MALSSRKHEVDVFYDHEGRYQRERGGLYKTSYDPKQLAAAMNAEEKGCGALGDLSTLERGALDFPTTLNDDMAEAIPRCRALSGSVPRYHNQHSVYEVMRPYDIAKLMQKRHLQPEPPSVGLRNQVPLTIYSKLKLDCTRKCGNYSDVLPLKAARRDSISNLTSFGASNLSCR